MNLADTVTSLEFFTAGTMLRPEMPSYVERPADDELLNLALARQFTYVFAAPDTGKSSLAIRTSQRLREQGVRTAVIFLSGSGDQTNPEQWYLGLAARMVGQLQLSVDPEAWWQEQSAKASQRFILFLRDVVLQEIKGPVVIFFDEIETVSDRKILVDLLAGIRAIYDARPKNHIYDRLSFVVLGVAEPNDLISDGKQSPFSIGKQVRLDDFSYEEALVLLSGLQTIFAEQAEPLFRRILYWTHGHPYLTQKLCQMLVNDSEQRWTEDRSASWIDWLVETTFLRPAAAFEEPHIQAIQSRMEQEPHRQQILALYRNVFSGKDIPDRDSSGEHQALKLIGLVRTENDRLKVRNEIYRRIFNLGWMLERKGANWGRALVIALMVLLFFLVGFFGISFYQQQRSVNADQAQTLIDSFRTDPSPEARLVNLAELFKLPGYEWQARQLFFIELDDNERLALFSVESPGEVEEQAVTVIKGVYTAPDLVDDQASNTLLRAMVQTLRQLDYSSALGVVDLELEINQWLKGREFREAGQYRQALDSYNYAIGLNARNPGTYFDRALTHQARGEIDEALADLVSTLNLQADWQPRVQQALVSSDALYNELWISGSYSRLAQLVPTPTSTPTPTATATLSPTPAPTNTPEPPTPTPDAPTPAATPTPTFSPVSAEPTVTPTPTEMSISARDITLLQPLSLDSPSYGPTTFEWQWNREVPAGYGFEVRVWREDESPAGVHNAVLDNQNGAIKDIGQGKYRLSTDIKEAGGVKGRSGEYLWTVALVRISPEYADLGEQAEPARLRFEAGGGGSSGGKDKGGGGGGGVGID